MANNLVTQSLKILGSAVQKTGKDYTSNLTSFMNDAKDVKNSIINAGTDAADTYARIKNTNITKAIHDWFYQEESDSDSLISNNDEFDAGFDSSSSGGEHKLDGESTPKALTADSMINIANKQTNAMIKVGRRQTEQSVANTAEIVSSLNSRSAEMLTAVNNINKTLIGISSRLDKIIELQAVPLTNKEDEIDKGGIFQDGKLSMMRILERMKSDTVNSGPMTFALSIMDSIRQGAFGPSDLLSMGIKGAAKKIMINGKSFDDWGNAFNEMIGTGVQTALNEMLNSSAIKRLFPGLTSFTGDKDWGTAVPNTYDTKRAVFDGMTRMSIVNVIPQMLAKINESISGQEYHLNDRGRWVAGPTKNEFNQVTRASFSSGGLSDNMMQRISNAGVQSIGKKISNEDIRDASEALTMSLVMALAKAGDRAFSVSRIKTELGAQVPRTAAVLAMLGKGDETYWTNVCQVVVMQLSTGALDSAGFVANVNQSVQKMIDDARKFTQSGKENSVQATRLTFEMAANQFLADKQAPTNTPIVQAVTNTTTNGLLPNADGKITLDTKTLGQFSPAQYVGGIFYLLNRGINVRIDKDGDKYDSIVLSQIRADIKPFENDNTFGNAVKQSLIGSDSMNDIAENAVKNSLGIKDKKGLLSKLFENPSMTLLTISNLIRGGGGEGGGLFAGLKNKVKNVIGEERYNKAAGWIDEKKGILEKDERYIAARDKVGEIRDKAADKFDEFTHSALVNNNVYRLDSMKLNSAENLLDHHVYEDEEDKLRVSIIKGYFSMGAIEDAEDYANQITDKDMRNTVFDMIKIHKNRRKGQLAQQAGETPDVGSVLITKSDDATVSPDDTEKSILGKMLGVVGNIAKNLAKLTMRGAQDVTIGLKSMAQGMLFGYDDTDSKGNTHRNKGFIRNLTTVPIMGTVKAFTSLTKKAIGAIKSHLGGDSKIAKIIKGGINIAKGIAGFIKDGFTWLKDTGIPGLWKGIKESKVGQAVGKAASTVGKFITNNKFGRGFVSGFKEASEKRKEAAEKKKKDDAREENPLQADQVDMIEGNKPSIFSKMFESITGIWESLNKQVDYTQRAYEESHGPEEERQPEVETTDIDMVNNSRSISNGLSEGDDTFRAENQNGGDNGGGERGGGIKGVLGSIGGVIGDIFGDLGKMMGGMTQVLLGIGEMVLGIVTSLEALGALKDMVTSIFEDGLQPLNEIFEQAMDVIKPIVDTLKGMVTMIAEVIVEIAKSIIDSVQPILETLLPIIETVIDFLSPILDIIKILMDVIMVPIKIAMDIITPVIEGIGYALQVISGVLQIGLGSVMGLLGGVVSALGLILSAIGSIPLIPGSGIKKSGESLKETGQNMLEMSKTMLAAGAEQMKQGIQGGLSLIQRLLPGGETGEKDEEEDDTESKDKRAARLTDDFAAGDVPSTTINNTWTYTYGSGNTNTTMNQHSYGGYMNMSERGCGPVALADAYGRRGGGNVNPALLAAAMSGAGTYDPRRGTSVSSMINTGNAMGMGMRLGGVTAASLSQSSPTNPITVLGSGTGFGTRSGNNHYVNVVGTDGNGSAYVANPMTGRVEKHATSNLVLNSKLGLYGSGDENEYEEYGFSDEAYESLEKLKNITSRLTNMFTGESDAETKIKKANAEQKAKEIQRTLGDDYDSVEKQVLTDLKAKYPDLSDDQLQKKLNSYEGWKLIAKYGGQSAVDTYTAGLNLVREGGTEAISNLESLQSQFSQMSTVGWEEGSVGSVTGAEMTPFGPIIFRQPYLSKTYITDDDGNQIPAALVGHDKNGGTVYKYFGSPVHNFFNSDVMASVNDGDDTTYTNDPGWFGNIGSPHSDEGVGTMGKNHEGVVLKFGRTRNIPAITGGTVTYVTKQNRTGKANGLGNSVKWRDSGGMYHWFMHLGSIGEGIAEGSDITPGMVIGTSGNTGEGGEAFDTPVVRYVVTSAGPMGNTGDAGYINPFTYWQFEESYNHGSYSKNDYMNGSFWNQDYADRFSNSDYHNQAQKAGLTGAQEAMVAAIGIHEDSGKKLFGEKSLTQVVYDCAAHPWAFGIMNWTPDPQNAYEGATETKYGTTLAEQLPYMYKMYFASNPEHERARIVSDNYAQYSGNLQTVLGHSLALKPGDAWGPLAETDIAEAMGHYVANALIPSDWYTTEGLGKRIGTAVDVYNWMIDKGWINASKQGVDGGTSINGHFVASQTNPDAFISQDGYFSSDGGAVLADYGKPTITSTNIEGTTSGNSPLHEFFSKTGGTGNAYSANENWYLKRLNPDKQGVGTEHSSLGEHGGVDFNWDTGSGGKELHATTHGTVDAVTTSGSAGNSIRWLDDAGYLHWYMHMRDLPLLAEKDEVKPGQLLGYVGNTGDSGGDHLHYSIIKADKFNGWSNSPGGVNPLMYFHNYNSAGPQTNPNERGGLSFVTGRTDTLMNDLTTYATRSTNGDVAQNIAANTVSAVSSIISSITGNNDVDDKLDSHATDEKNELIPDDFSDTVLGKMIYYVTKDDSNNNTRSKGSFGGGVHQRGGGDVPSSWYDTLFNNNGLETVSNYVPPLDESQFTNESSALQNMVNRFNIRSSDSATTDMLDRMSSMTFNVRAKRVEELLEILIAKVDNNSTTGQPSPNMFEDGIPEAVTRLSIG